MLSNAAKFTPTGGTVEFTGEKTGQDGNKIQLRFHVKDDGIGMSSEFLTHLYDPFSQERSKIGDTVKGTGLGLPIVKSLVAEKDEQEPKPDVSSGNLKDARILLVEDNEINIYVAQLILEKAGCIVDMARQNRCDYSSSHCHDCRCF